MNLPKYSIAAAMLSLAAAAHADPLISETFDNVSTLAANGWVLSNNSVPIGTTDWAQGDVNAAGDLFYGDGWTGGGYITGNYNNVDQSGAVPNAFLNNFLITPTFSTELAGTVSFFAKAAVEDPYFDLIRVGFSNGSANPFLFSLTSAITLTGDWVEYTFSYAAGGIGSMARFAIDYTGFASNANYIGIDNLTVTPVPEPSTWAMFALGLGALAFYGRRRTAKQQA